MSDDLEKIYKKFFDDSGNMKQSGKDIVSKGMKGISQGPKTVTEKGLFLPPKTASTVSKAIKATRYGRIAAGVAAAGLAAKEYLKSKMDKKDVEKKSTGGDNNLSAKQKKIARMAGDPNKIEGEDFKKLRTEKASKGMMIGKGKDYIKDLL